MMAHLPMAFLDHSPQRTLVVCFGMGTTYRSLLSSGIPTTAVKLVPNYQAIQLLPCGRREVLRSPLSHIVIDDGRRYLGRAKDVYDVITLDPPPPIKAAGSSLLYSREFYAAVRERLAPGGILQQWLPGGDPTVRAAVTRALEAPFQHVRVFSSVEHYGFHFVASQSPIPNRSAEELVRRMPEKAQADLMEWGPKDSPKSQFAEVLQSELPPDALLARDPNAPMLEDDRPVNEYYLLREARSVFDTSAKQ